MRQKKNKEPWKIRLKLHSFSVIFLTLFWVSCVCGAVRTRRCREEKKETNSSLLELSDGGNQKINKIKQSFCWFFYQVSSSLVDLTPVVHEQRVSISSLSNYEMKQATRPDHKTEKRHQKYKRTKNVNTFLKKKNEEISFQSFFSLNSLLWKATRRIEMLIKCKLCWELFSCSKKNVASSGRERKQNGRKRNGPRMSVGSSISARMFSRIFQLIKHEINRYLSMRGDTLMRVELLNFSLRRSCWSSSVMEKRLRLLEKCRNLILNTRNVVGSLAQATATAKH